jgi:hypothetical protein
VETDATPTLPLVAETDEAERSAAPDRSIRRQVLLILAFVTLSVLLLTLAAGGVDAAGNAVTHLFAGPEGCGGG